MLTRSTSTHDTHLWLYLLTGYSFTALADDCVQCNSAISAAQYIRSAVGLSLSQMLPNISYLHATTRGGCSQGCGAHEPARRRRPESAARRSRGTAPPSPIAHEESQWYTSWFSGCRQVASQAALQAWPIGQLCGARRHTWSCPHRRIVVLIRLLGPPAPFGALGGARPAGAR